MRIKFLESFLVVILLIMSLSGFSQESVAKPDALKAIIDSLKQKGIVLQQSAVSPEIKLSYEQALKLLQNTTKPNYWVNHDDPFRKALNRLL